MRWRENRATYTVNKSPACVFVASDQGTSPGTAGPLSRVMQAEVNQTDHHSDEPENCIYRSNSQIADSDSNVEVNVDSFVNFELIERHSAVKVRGRLKDHVQFWRAIGANQWVLQIIEQGYCLPFLSIPPVKAF